MEKQVRIKIRKLGKIVDSEEIVLNQLMVFSGESGMGKSYLSTICNYVFRMLLDEERVSSFFHEKGLHFSDLRKDYHGTGTAVTFTKREFEQWLAKDAIVWLGFMIRNKDIIGDIDILLPDNIPTTIKIMYEEEMVGLENDVETYIKLSLPGLSYRIKDSGGLDDESPFAYLFRYYLIQQLFGNFRDLTECYIFPPSRATMMTENVEPLTGMYSVFKENVRNLIKAKPTKIDISERLSRLLNRVLDGRVNYREGQYLYTTDGQEMPLSAAAASVRELASIEFLVENDDISKVAVMIDEPEAHLHPLKQRLMADIMCCILNEGTHIQITTHSDYFLRRLNELVMKNDIWKRSQENGDNEYYKMCSELRLDPDLRLDGRKISAYLLERNEEGSVVIRQDMSNGIPFAAFHDALTESLNMKYQLEKRKNGTVD